MAKTEKKKVQQTKLAFNTPVAPVPNACAESGVFCPVYYPQTGDGLADLARRLAPVLARTGWNVRIVEGEGAEPFLELQNKDGHCRRLSAEETLAWQALLPQLSLPENLFSTTGPGDRKDA